MPEVTTLWFCMVALLVSVWAVMDGFDFGVGVLHRLVARTDTERRQVLAAIGPVWDGNEVWLLAAGGSMFLAFPRLLAAGFSGLYLLVIYFVWSLMFRGLSIELRSHVSNPLWREFFDLSFQVSSTLAALLIGLALGNVLRGVPLEADGLFTLPLFASLDAFGSLGVVDWYTVSVAGFVLAVLTGHGGMYLRWKTDGVVRERVQRVVAVAWVVAAVLGLVVTGGTLALRPEFTGHLGRPMVLVGEVLVVGGAVVIVTGLRSTNELRGFLGSCALILGLMVTTVGCLFPMVLPARPDVSLSLTVFNASSQGGSMRAGLVWWLPGVGLAAGYLWWVLRHFRGKVVAAVDGEGY